MLRAVKSLLLINLNTLLIVLPLQCVEGFYSVPDSKQ